MNVLAQQVAKFRHWAESSGFHPGSGGEWECDYPDWQQLYAAVEYLLESTRDRILLPDELELLLYALARDNEDERILETLEQFPGTALQVAHAALGYPDADARWQSAVLLGRISTPKAASLLQCFVSDEAEYVRRRAGFALQELNRKG